MRELSNHLQHASTHPKPKRSVQKTAAALAIVLALGLGSCDKDKEKSPIKKIPTPIELQGRKVNDLYSFYLGYGGGKAEIGDTIVFNPNQVIQDLYEKKLEKETKGLEVAGQYYENVISKIDFSDDEASNFKQYQKDIQKMIDEVNENFDWEGFAQAFLDSSKEKSQIFQQLSQKIDKELLMAYSMTELFPATDKINLAIYDFLLQHGGKDLIYHLPAINDDYASFGPYQLTSYAVYDVEQKKGASILNDFLPKELRIPGSVTKLEGDEHHKAAYLFAMCNIYVLLKNKENIPALKYLAKQGDNNNLLQILAIMHNKPNQGANFLQERYKLNTDAKYLKKKVNITKTPYKYDTNNNGKIDLYESKLSPKPSHNYGKKTYYNRRLLK